VLGAEPVRSRKTMKATVSDAAKRTKRWSKRAAAAFCSLSEKKDEVEETTLFDAMRKDMFTIGMPAINATAPSVVVSGAVASAEGASACTMSGTAAAASAAADASAVASTGGGKDAALVLSDESDTTTTVAEGLGRDKRGFVQIVRLTRGRNAMAAKSKAGNARINKTQTAIDLTGPDGAAVSGGTDPAARGGTRRSAVGDTIRTLSAASAGTG